MDILIAPASLILLQSRGICKTRTGWLRMADADGGWRMADGGWRMADGGWENADDKIK